MIGLTIIVVYKDVNFDAFVSVFIIIILLRYKSRALIVGLIALAFINLAAYRTAEFRSSEVYFKSKTGQTIEVFGHGYR